MSAVGMVATSEDGRNVLISLGVSKNASVFVMEIGNADNELDGQKHNHLSNYYTRTILRRYSGIFFFFDTH